MISWISKFETDVFEKSYETEEKNFQLLKSKKTPIFMYKELSMKNFELFYELI